MLILGIETSCDDTAVALVRDGRDVLASRVHSQTAVHEKFGGVVPEIAAREHLANISNLFRSTLDEAGIGEDAIDAIAVTQGPGLSGALLVGVSFAKGTALRLGVPLIPVHHVRAHAHGAFLGLSKPLLFPNLTLIVSGGHTSISRADSYTSFVDLAQTRDDACGECLDKVAIMYGLPYPGGPEIEKVANGGDPQSYAMPKFSRKGDLSFSYSGLKTHMLYLGRKLGSPVPDLSNVMASFQAAAFGQLVAKLAAALAGAPEVRSIVVAGGVAANKELRRQLLAEFDVPVLFPALRYCTDNAAMVAAYGFHIFTESPDQQRFQDHNWDIHVN